MTAAAEKFPAKRSGVAPNPDAVPGDQRGIQAGRPGLSLEDARNVVIGQGTRIPTAGSFSIELRSPIGGAPRPEESPFRRQDCLKSSRSGRLDRRA